MFFFAFGFLASWLLGFSASWLLGFLASRLLGFLASRLLGFSAFCWFRRFWWLFGFGFSHPLHSQFLFGRWRFGFCVYAAFGGLFASSAFTVPLWAFWQLHPFIGFWIWLPLFESTLLQKSSCGAAPPTHALLFRFLAEIELHPYLNHHFFERPISRENAAKYKILGNLCNPCMSVCMHFFEHDRGSHPRQPSRCLLNSIASFLDGRHHGGPPQPPRYVLDFLQRLNCTPS